MSAAIEQRYRSALRWYPRSWRDQHGDVVISTLLDVADGERRTVPRRSELLNLAAIGLATRLGILLSAGARDGISTVALGSGAVFAVVFFIFHTWSPWAGLDMYTAVIYPSFGPFVNPGVLVYAIWVGALVLGLLSWHRILRYLLIAAVIAPLLLRLINRLQGDIWLGPTATTLGFFSLLALCVLIGTPRRPDRIAIAAATTSAGLYIVYALEWVPRPYYVADRFFWSEIGWSYSVALVVLVGVIAGICLGIARRPTAALTVLGSVVPWVAIWCIGALRSDLWNSLAVMCLLLVAVGFALACRLAVQRSREAFHSNQAASK